MQISGTGLWDQHHWHYTGRCCWVSPQLTVREENSARERPWSHLETSVQSWEPHRTNPWHQLVKAVGWRQGLWHPRNQSTRVSSPHHHDTIYWRIFFFMSHLWSQLPQGSSSSRTYYGVPPTVRPWTSSRTPPKPMWRNLHSSNLPQNRLITKPDSDIASSLITQHYKPGHLMLV